jgi:hypothetical protein
MVPSIVVLCSRRSNSRDPPHLPHAAPHVTRLIIADRATPIIQYCPIRLGRGATAHLRRGWRFVLEVVCSTDGSSLRDTCRRCAGFRRRRIARMLCYAGDLPMPCGRMISSLTGSS